MAILSLMAISFRAASLPPLDQFTAEVPDGAIVGLTGEESPALSAVTRLAAGLVSLPPASSRPRSHDATSDPPIPLTSSLPLPSSSTAHCHSRTP